MGKLGILNLLMFVLLLALAAFIYFAPEAEKPVSHKVSQLQPEQVTHILLQRNNQDDVQLKKTGDGWQLYYQQQWLPAHQWRVDQLLKLLQADSEHRFQSKEWEKFGLAPPRASLQFNEQRLLIGDNDPIKRQRYIASGDDIMLVTDLYYIHLFADISDYLSLAPLEQMDIQDVQINGKPSTRKDDDKRAWLDAWQHLQALQVHQADDVQNGDTITLILADNRQFHLLRQGNLLVRTDIKVAYELSDNNVQQLFKQP